MPKHSTYPTILEETRSFSTSDLKKWGYFKPHYQSGTMRWSRNGLETSSISLATDVANTYVQLSYSKIHTKEEFNYKIQLVGIPSNLGKGEVLHFVCPITGKRCRKLYSNGRHYVSRQAIPNAMYESQKQSKRWRQWEKVYGGCFKQDKWFKEINSKHFKKYYKGEPTKRYKRLWLKIQSVPEITPEQWERFYV